MSSLRSKFRLTRRRLVWLWAAGGTLLPLFFPVWVFVRGPRAVPVSKETTFLTEPILENGHVDYAHGVNELLLSDSADAEAVDTYAVNSAVKELAMVLDSAKRTSSGRKPWATFTVEVPTKLREIAHLLNGPANLEVSHGTLRDREKAIGQRYLSYRDLR